MDEINLKEFTNFYFSKIKIILIMMFLFLIGGYIYIAFILTPMYHSSTTLILVSNNNSDNSSLIQNNINLNKNLVSTYSQIIKSRTVLKKVIKKLDLNMSVEKLSKRIDVKSIEDTEMIRIEVSDENNHLAKYIVENVTDVFMNEVKKIYNLTNISIVDKAQVEKKPYNINLVKQLFIITLAGFLLGTVIVFLIFYFDTTIKSSKEIEEKLGLSVIGHIPLVNKQ